jgi:hypothetical protein
MLGTGRGRVVGVDVSGGAERRAVVSLDGGGVVADTVLLTERPMLPVRLRLHPTGDPSEDVTVFVEDGVVHVVGQYGTVHAERLAANHVGLSVVKPGRAGTASAGRKRWRAPRDGGYHPPVSVPEPTHPPRGPAGTQ